MAPIYIATNVFLITIQILCIIRCFNLPVWEVRKIVPWQFINNIWHWASFHIFVSHLYFFFYKFPIHVSTDWFLKFVLLAMLLSGKSASSEWTRRQWTVASAGIMRTWAGKSGLLRSWICFLSFLPSLLWVCVSMSGFGHMLRSSSLPVLPWVHISQHHAGEWCPATTGRGTVSVPSRPHPSTLPCALRNWSACSASVGFLPSSCWCWFQTTRVPTGDGRDSGANVLIPFSLWDGHEPLCPLTKGLSS